MPDIHQLYTKDNYTIQKSINIDEQLYETLQYILYKEYNSNISELINFCVERLLQDNKKIYYYARPERRNCFI